MEFFWFCLFVLMLYSVFFVKFLSFCFACPHYRKALCWFTATLASRGHQPWSLATWCHVTASHLMEPFQKWNQLIQPLHPTMASWNNWGASNLKLWMDLNTKQERKLLNWFYRDNTEFNYTEFWWKSLDVIVKTEGEHQICIMSSFTLV